MATDLAITKTDGNTSVVPGTSDTYTIVVSNNGPDTVIGASVSDPLPAGASPPPPGRPRQQRRRHRLRPHQRHRRPGDHRGPRSASVNLN